MEKITLCGDDCCKCPRYLARTNGELEKVAELWFRIGWRDRIVPIEEIRCSGCSSHKQCTYRLVDCVKENHVEKCSQCPRFPCRKITDSALEVPRRTRKNARRFARTKNTAC